MAAAGIVLSHPTRITRPSKPLPRATSSIESAITSRLTSEAFIPSVPIVMPSEIDTVLNSMGVPPAAQIVFRGCQIRVEQIFPFPAWNRTRLELGQIDAAQREHAQRLEQRARLV